MIFIILIICYYLAVFHPYGDVTLVRVLKPGKQLPFDTKQYASKIPELGTVTCALIDFETARAAKFAVHVLRQRADEIGFRLALLKPGIEEKLYENELELKQGCRPKHNEYFFDWEFFPSQIMLVTVRHPN